MVHFNKKTLMHMLLVLTQLQNCYFYKNGGKTKDVLDELIKKIEIFIKHNGTYETAWLEVYADIVNKWSKHVA